MVIHGPEHTRDRPAHCTCMWEWVAPLRRWIRTGHAPECAWHLSNAKERL